MNSLCTTGSGMSGLTSSVISVLGAPTGLTVNNSIAIPLDSDADLVLHYPLNGDILNYGSSTSLNTNLGPTIGVSDASFVPLTGSTVSLNSSQSIFKNGTSLLQSASNNTSYISITNIPTNTNGYSFSFWVYFTATTTGIIFSFANAYDTNVDRIMIWNLNGTLYFGCNNVFYTNSAIFPPLNTWRYFVWTLDTTGKTNIYVNGVLTVTNNTTVPYKSFVFNYNWILGDTFRGASQYGALGYINDFRYYNRILNIYEVIQLYNIAFPLNNDPSLILYYPFNYDFLNYASGIGISNATPSGIINYSNYKVGRGSLFLNTNTSFAITGYIPPNTGGYTFSFWIKFDTMAAGANTTSSFINFNNNQGAGLKRQIMFSTKPNTTSGVVYFETMIGATTNTLTLNTININTWYHLAVTLTTGNNFIYYVNGVSNITNTITYTTVSGGTNNIQLYNSTGYMDDFRYYNRVLNQAEITVLYNYKNSILNPFNLNSDPSLCLYYTFDTSTNTVSNYAKNVYGTVDASYANGASVNYADLTYVGTGGLKLNNSIKVVSSIPSWATTTQGLNYPTGVDIDSTNTYMYVLNNGNNSISRISTANPATFIASWFATNLSSPTGIVIDSLDTYMYVIDSTNIKKIPLSNPSGYSVLATLGTSNGALAIDNTNTYLYATNTGSNLIYKIIISNSTYTTFATSTQGLNFPVGLAIDPNNTYIYVSNNSTNAISRILLSNSATYVVNWATSAQGIAGPNHLVVDSKNNYLYIVNVTPNTVSQISIASPTTVFNATYATSTQGVNIPYGITLDPSNSYMYVVNVLGGSSAIGTISQFFNESQYISLKSNSVVNTTNFISNNGMTFSCWFYSSDNSNNAPIFNFGTDTGDDVALTIYTNQILCKLLNTGTFYYLNSPTAYNKSMRHVVWTMTYSAAATSTWNLYIDASMVNTISTNKYPLQVARNTNYLGKSKYATDPFYNGYIDDFRVYQRVLTQTEITQLFSYNNTLNVKSGNFSWTAPNTTKTPLTYNYFYKDNSLNITTTTVNTTYKNTVINNLIDGDGITYSVNSQVNTKQSKYTSITK